MKNSGLPIRTILLAAFLLVGLLPIVLMSVLAFNEAKSALTIEIYHDMQARAKATTDEIDRMMFERLQNVASWSQLEVMQDAKIGDVDKRLSNFLLDLKTSYHDVYLQLHVIDFNGKIIASSHYQHIGQSYYLPETWLNVAMPQGKVSLRKITKQVLPITITLEDRIQGKQLGLLVVEFNWQQVQTILENAVSGRSAAALYDVNQQLIAQSSLWLPDKTHQNIIAQANTSAYQGLAGFNWHLKIAQHQSDVMAPVHRMTNIFIGLLVASILLATLIGIPVARAISQPLVQLKRFTKEIVRHPTAILPPRGGPTEVRELSEAFIQMIKDLEHSKQALTRAAKLAVAGEMAAAMSHEIRTPLGILRSSAQVLMREPQLTKDGIEVCGFIISETDRLNKLVNTLIDSARPHTPHYAKYDLANLIDQVVCMLRLQADRKHILIKYTKPAEILIYCDDEQITQVLLNLIINAIQILPDAGKIFIHLFELSDNAIISIADNGPGISDSLKEHIFEPFVTKREGGVGLGLAVVRQIVEAHQGSISIHTSQMDDLKQGAEFRVILPLIGASEF